MLLEKPKRLSSVHSERSRPRPRAQRCQAGVGVPAVSIRAQGSQEGRAGRSPWPGVGGGGHGRVLCGLARPQVRLSAPRRCCGIRIGILGLSEAQAADWGKARGRMWAGEAMGPSQLRQLPGLTQGTAHPILGRCHAFGTWVIKGLALFLSLPCSESFCYPPSESGGRAPGLAPAS